MASTHIVLAAIMLGAASVVALLCASAAARAQSLSFTYQGEASCADGHFYDTSGLQCIACGDGEVRCSTPRSRTAA